jgi:spore maturation protein CgeB
MTSGVAGTWRVQPARGTILIVGDLLAPNKVIHIADALRADGWDVVELEQNRFIGSGGNDPIRKVIDRFAPRLRILRLASVIETAAIQCAADAVLYCKGIGATSQLLTKLSSRGCRSICWYPDRDFDHPFVDRNSLALFDLFITTKSYHVDFLRSLRAEKPTIVIDHGYCPGVHWRLEPPIPPEQRPFDLIFVGNHSAYKESWIRHILRELPSLTVAICGARWPEAILREMRITATQPPLVGDLMSRAINHARIGLALHHGAHEGTGWEDFISARTFEIPACGTFMLHIDNADLRKCFTVGREVDCFSDASEAAAKIRYWLDNPEEREAMASRAFARAVPAYSYFQRGIEISNAIQHELGAKD